MRTLYKIGLLGLIPVVLLIGVLRTGPNDAVSSGLTGYGPATISASYVSGCSLTMTGGAVCWGGNVSGALGIGRTAAELIYVTRPVGVVGLRENQATAVSASAGHNFACAIKLGGDVACWGLNSAGQLGDGSFIDRTMPVDVDGLLDPAIDIEADGDLVCVVVDTGQVNCWGSNSHGQLGVPTSDTPETCSGFTILIACSSAPVVVKDGTGSPLTGVVAVDLGAEHACALIDDGPDSVGHSLRCWGSNVQGQLGDGMVDPGEPGYPGSASERPPVTPFELDQGVIAVSAGFAHTCALVDDGPLLPGHTAKCWGAAWFGQLGIGNPYGLPLCENPVIGFNLGNFPGPLEDVQCATTPVSVCADDLCNSLTGLTGVVSISAGFYHTCATMIDRSAKCWGDQTLGALGDGVECEPDGGTWTCFVLNANADYINYFPVDVCDVVGCSAALGNVLQVSAGYGNTCAVVEGAKVGAFEARCWGDGSRGRNGDGTINLSAIPVEVLYDDTDADGCNDESELGGDATLGGVRDPSDPWDFYDVASLGGVPIPDGIIDLPNDILGVIQHYAPQGTEPRYDVHYDRGPSAGPNAWNMTAPDGVIDLPNDILGAILQHGHTCA